MPSLFFWLWLVLKNNFNNDVIFLWLYQQQTYILCVDDPLTSKGSQYIRTDEIPLPQRADDSTDSERS